MKMRLLSIGAHPDDLEFGCAGMARKAIKAGGEVMFLTMTYGERGGDKETRRMEQEMACKMLGIRKHYILGLPDLGVKATDKNCEALAAIVHGFKPHLILTHAPRDKHPDHIETTTLVQRVAKEAGIPLLFFRSFSTLAFDPVVTIRHDSANDKRAAINCHKSQVDKYRERGVDFEGIAMSPNENEEAYETM